MVQGLDNPLVGAEVKGIYPELVGKHALVTGAARGFGKAIALRLAREGVRVVVNYRRSMSDAASVVEEIKDFGGEAIAVRGDVGKEGSLEKLFEAIRVEYGRLDIVVANAAFGVPGQLMDTTSKTLYRDLTGRFKKRGNRSLS